MPPRQHPRKRVCGPCAGPCHDVRPHLRPLLPHEFRIPFPAPSGRGFSASPLRLSRTSAPSPNPDAAACPRAERPAADDSGSDENGPSRRNAAIALKNMCPNLLFPESFVIFVSSSMRYLLRRGAWSRVFADAETGCCAGAGPNALRSAGSASSEEFRKGNAPQHLGYAEHTFEYARPGRKRPSTASVSHSNLFQS